MSRVEILKQASETYSVKFLEFTRINSKIPDTIVCIFEGEDEKYYSNRISEGLKPYSWCGINAGGKKTVLELHEIISKHPNYKTSKFVCFVDKDFEDWIINMDPSRIYITPCYSIENFYISESVFSKVISSEFKITEFNEFCGDFKKIIKLFVSRKSEFKDAISVFNHWVKAHRIMERDGKTTKTLNVNNVKTEDLVFIGIDRIERIYNPEDPCSAFKDAHDLVFCPQSIDEAQSTLPEDEWESLYRGKQIIDFMRVFLNKLKEDRSSKNPNVFSSKGKVCLSLSRGNVISEISQYADTPPCLCYFLENYRQNLKAESF